MLISTAEFSHNKGALNGGKLSGYDYVTFTPPLSEEQREQVPNPNHDSFRDGYPFPIHSFIEDGTEHIGFPKDFFKSAGAENIYVYAERIARVFGGAAISDVVEKGLNEHLSNRHPINA